MCPVAAIDGYRKGQGSGQETGGRSRVGSGIRGKTLGGRKSQGGKQAQNLTRG